MTSGTDEGRSRRAVLAAASGAIAAIAAQAALPATGLAGAGDVKTDQDNPVSDFTSLTNFDDTSITSVFGATHAGAGAALVGTSALSYAVYGSSGSTTGSAIKGSNSSSGDGLEGISTGGIGVRGSGGVGVKGFGTVGVAADVGTTETAMYANIGASVAPAPPAGVALVARAQSTALVALHVKGRAKFDRSGILTVASGSSSVFKSLSGVTSASMVMAVLQDNRAGVWVRAAVPGAGNFTVYLNKQVATATSLMYFVIG